jgi:hypothetical protein
MLKKAASFVLASLRGSTYRSVRLASLLAAASLTVFLNILLAFLILSARGDRLMIAPRPTMSIGRKLLFTRSNQFTLDFARAFSYTYEVLLPCLGGYGGGVS